MSPSKIKRFINTIAFLIATRFKKRIRQRDLIGFRMYGDLMPEYCVVYDIDIDANPYIWGSHFSTPEKAKTEYLKYRENKHPSHSKYSPFNYTPISHIKRYEILERNVGRKTLREMLNDTD